MSVAHSMSLEAQSVDATTLKNQKEELAKKIYEYLNKKFWTDDFNSIVDNKKKNKLLQKLINNIQKKK